MDERNLASPLANQIVTGSFRGKSVVKLNAVRPFALEAVNQRHVRPVNIQREAGADNQDIVAQAAAELFERVHHPVAGVGEAQQQMLLMLTQLFFQGIQIAGGLIDIILGANHPDAARALAEQ